MVVGAAAASERHYVMSQPLDYFAPPRRRSPLPAIIDAMALIVALLVVNAVMLLLTFRATRADQGAYPIFYGPANAAVTILSLVCTPLATRLSRDLTVRVHVTMSLVFPIAAIIIWISLFDAP